MHYERKAAFATDRNQKLLSCVFFARALNGDILFALQAEMTQKWLTRQMSTKIQSTSLPLLLNKKLPAL